MIALKLTIKILDLKLEITHSNKRDQFKKDLSVKKHFKKSHPKLIHPTHENSLQHGLLARAEEYTDCISAEG